LIPSGNPYSENPSTYFENHTLERSRRTGQRLAERAREILGRTGSMVEIGCGRGHLLLGARDAGWDVTGIEMTAEFADEAERSGIPIRRQAVEEATLPAADVIVFAGVLEHLYEPVRALRAAFEALNANGLVYADVPNEASLVLLAGNFYMKARGRDWSVNLSPTFPPFHVVGFTPRSLKTAFERAGFEIVVVRNYPWDSCLPQSRRLERAGYAVATWLGNRLGMGEGLDIWASKRPRGESAPAGERSPG
jgi:SAM-dependent methyltransferase